MFSVRFHLLGGRRDPRHSPRAGNWEGRGVKGSLGQGGDRDREGFPSWNSVSRHFHCSRAAPGAGAGENSLDLVVLRCHGVFGVFEVWGVAGQPGERGARGAVEVMVEDGPGVTWGGLGTC